MDIAARRARDGSLHHIARLQRSLGSGASSADAHGAFEIANSAPNGLKRQRFSASLLSPPSA
ncbi:Hypothetical protein A7982_01194 [Minicystis rosea]|nr:Hypothetical protein A7982_01194 [Minicystis rosea]